MKSKLTHKINRFMEARQPWQIVLSGLALLGLVGTQDHATPQSLSLSIFYLIPIMLVAWYVGKRAAYTMCVVAAFTMIFTDYTSGEWLGQNRHWISLWNAAVQISVFIFMAYLLANMRANLMLEQTLARKDALTGVRNSFAFKEEINMFVMSAVRHKQALALGYIDLDDFKSVNDMMGHAAGDQVLEAVGATLSDSVRGSDLVGRLGGDEFAVLLPNTGISGAKIFFDTLHKRLVDEMKDGGWPVGFSIGVAVFPDGPLDNNDVLASADSLMYRVKRSGKNSVIYEEFARAKTNAQQTAPAEARNLRD